MAGGAFRPSIEKTPTDFEKELVSKMLENAIICPICLDTLIKPQGLECKHVFCKKCVQDWMVSHDTCPICRNQIRRPLVDCKWLESIIASLKGTPVTSITPRNFSRRSTLVSIMNGSSVRRNNGKENINRPPWR